MVESVDDMVGATRWAGWVWNNGERALAKKKKKDAKDRYVSIYDIY